MDRLDVEFQSAGIPVHAWLYLPAADEPRPVVVMAHGLGGIKEMRLDAFAERFVEAGYAALVFDYRFFGSSGGEPRQLLSIDAQLADWRAAVDHARQRPDVDGSRIILWGTSFGGGHVLITAAEAGPVAAVISQCPFTDGLSSALALDPISAIKVGALAVRDKIAAALGRPRVMVATAGPPRSAALMTAPDAEPGYLELLPAGTAFRNEVAASIGLEIGLHRPGSRTPQISAPVLFVVCREDSVAPSAATLRHAAKAPRGRIEVVDYGHFDIYVDHAFDVVVAREIGFLTDTVPVR